MFAATQFDVHSVNSANIRQFFTKVSDTNTKTEKPKDEKESNIFGEGIDRVFNFFTNVKDELFSEKTKEGQPSETTSTDISAVVSTLITTGNSIENNSSVDGKNKK